MLAIVVINICIIDISMIKNNVRSDESGFSLVELLAAIIVLGIVAGSITAIFGGIQRVQTATNYHETATRSAQREIEVLRNNNYGSLTPGVNIDFTSSLPSTLPNEKTGTVVVTEPVSGLRRVDVTVSYKHGEKTHNVRLSSMIGEIGISQ